MQTLVERHGIYMTIEQLMRGLHAKAQHTASMQIKSTEAAQIKKSA
jgi:hypothetical protein